MACHDCLQCRMALWMSPGVYHLATYMQRMQTATEARAPDRQLLMSRAQQLELAKITDLRARGVVEASIDKAGTPVRMHLRQGRRQGGKQSKPHTAPGEKQEAGKPSKYAEKTLRGMIYR